MKRSRSSFLRGAAPGPDDRGESIEELARRVLFSTSLDEKLQTGSLLGPHEPEPEKPVPNWGGVLPGRPDSLRFARPGEERPDLPGRASLVNDESRGMLLHFFANHELLAAELMALALLKFPDAPPEFRKGLVDTLREEQFHTRWYVNRMQECGVSFGQYSLSRFFWDAVSGMESPLDYVSRLSLTFEQANLDYARHYAGILEEAGDSKSASILRKIYRDEIKHVGYGLKWFRRWRASDKTDWEALSDRLVFPLSPSRGKGNGTDFNEEGRRLAGFDEDFIRRLDLFGRSKGRTPNVYLFNPEAENRMAEMPSDYLPNDAVQSVMEDLEILVAFLARRDDVALMRRPPSLAHQKHLRDSGFALPEIEALDPQGHLCPDGLLAGRKIDELRPWSVAPNLPTALHPLPERSGRQVWRPSFRELFSKAEQAGVLSRWMGDSMPCHSEDDFRRAAKQLRERGHEEAVIKRGFSTAGGGMRAIRLADSLDGCWSGSCVLEPRHERVFDFSVQYEHSSDGLKYIGFVHQIISPGGGYRGSLSFIKSCEGLSADLSRTLMENALPFYQSGQPLPSALAAWAARCEYQGAIGIDGYIYRGTSGKLETRLACEINARYTMGRVAIELRRRIAPGYGLKLELMKAKSLSLPLPEPSLDGENRMTRGALILNELHSRSRFAAKISVAKQGADL